VADEPSNSELAWRQAEHARQTAQEHRDLNDRITRVAAEAVQADVHDRIERDRDKEFGKLDRRVEALEKRPALTAGRWAVIATAIVAVLALAVQAYGTLKGAHS
jgi:anti-sigma-K factor RskA